jgi:hypothetical protein
VAQCGWRTGLLSRNLAVRGLTHFASLLDPVPSPRDRPTQSRSFQPHQQCVSYFVAWNVPHLCKLDTGHPVTLSPRPTLRCTSLACHPVPCISAALHAPMASLVLSCAIAPLGASLSDFRISMLHVGPNSRVASSCLRPESLSTAQKLFFRSLHPDKTANLLCAV